jgi:hypothetical protein
MALLKLWWLIVPTVVARSTGEPGTATEHGRSYGGVQACETSSAPPRLLPAFIQRTSCAARTPGKPALATAVEYRRSFDDPPPEAATSPASFVMGLQHSCVSRNTCKHGCELCKTIYLCRASPASARSIHSARVLRRLRWAIDYASHHLQSTSLPSLRLYPSSLPRYEQSSPRSLSTRLNLQCMAVRPSHVDVCWRNKGHLAGLPRAGKAFAAISYCGQIRRYRGTLDP